MQLLYTKNRIHRWENPGKRRSGAAAAQNSHRGSRYSDASPPAALHGQAEFQHRLATGQRQAIAPCI